MSIMLRDARHSQTNPEQSVGATGSGPPNRPNRPSRPGSNTPGRPGSNTPRPPKGDGGTQGGRPNNPGPAFGGGPDNSLNDIDESDVNCDNTGTCYDGKMIGLMVCMDRGS